MRAGNGVRANAAQLGRKIASRRAIGAATEETERSALPARWGNRHGLFTNQAGIIGDTWPGEVRPRDDDGRRTFGDEQKFFYAPAQNGLARQLLACGVFRGFGDATELAGLTRVEGHLQRLGGGHGRRVVVKHFRPGHDLHHVPQRAVGTKPGEQQATDRKMTTHGGKFS